MANTIAKRGLLPRPRYCYDCGKPLKPERYVWEREDSKLVPICLQCWRVQVRNPNAQTEVKIAQIQVHGWEIQDLHLEWQLKPDGTFYPYDPVHNRKGRTYGAYITLKQAKDEAKQRGFKVVRIEKWNPI